MDLVGLGVVLDEVGGLGELLFHLGRPQTETPRGLWGLVHQRQLALVLLLLLDEPLPGLDQIVLELIYRQLLQARCRYIVLNKLTFSSGQFCNTIRISNAKRFISSLKCFLI